MSALRLGFLWAALAAIAFGITTPLVAHLTIGTGTWFTAGWLYLGAAIFALAVQRDVPVLVRGFREHWAMLLTIAAIGGMLAPAAYVLGVRNAGAFSASLALNMEAPFSIALAAIAIREFVGIRVTVAMTAIVIGAIVMSIGAGPYGPVTFGIGLIVLATALWAIDNALSSRLGSLDARITVFWKSAAGAVLSLSVALIAGEPAGSPATIVGLIGVGAVGYGASLVCYLTAQRLFGVARTASVFATAPFVGAVAAIAAGGAGLSAASVFAMVLMLAGVYLHATERHAHEHLHRRSTHEHVHSHDDLHHDHAHDPPVAGEHSHLHEHAPRRHTHEHLSDLEHQHSH